MASLYDLELQESNNFILALIDGGETPALKLMEDQKNQVALMGEMGKELLKEFEDENSDTAKMLTKLQALKNDIKSAMEKVGLEPSMAADANKVFKTSPESMSVLAEADQKTIKDYWLKKKSIILILLTKGYTHSELFS